MPKDLHQCSSGNIIIGGLPFSGFGASTSCGHASTQALHPLHTSGLNIIGCHAVLNSSSPLLIYSIGIVPVLTFPSSILIETHLRHSGGSNSG